MEKFKPKLTIERVLFYDKKSFKTHTENIDNEICKEIDINTNINEMNLSKGKYNIKIEIEKID